MKVIPNLLALLFISHLSTQAYGTEPDGFSLESDVVFRFGVITKHTHDRGQYNNHNGLVGIAVNNFEFGTYYNSEWTRSYYAGYRVETNPLNEHGTSLGAILMVVSGYSFAPSFGPNPEDTVLMAPVLFVNPIPQVSVVTMGNAFMGIINVRL